MIVLLANDSLEVDLAAAHTTNALTVLAGYKDADYAAASLVMGRNSTSTNGTTAVTAVAAPTGSVQRLVSHLSVYNNDTVSHTVTISYNNNATLRIMEVSVLAPGDLLRYSPNGGWTRISSTVIPSGYQPIKVFTVHADATVNFAMTNATLAERFALNITRSNFMVDLAGYTQVRLQANVQVASASAGSPKFRAKYNTAWSTTVGAFSQLGLSAQVEVSVAAVNFVDTGWMDLATLARANGVCIGFTEVGGDGVADPALGVTDIMFR